MYNIMSFRSFTFSSSTEWQLIGSFDPDQAKAEIFQRKVNKHQKKPATYGWRTVYVCKHKTITGCKYQMSEVFDKQKPNVVELCEKGVHNHEENKSKHRFALSLKEKVQEGVELGLRSNQIRMVRNFLIYLRY